MRKINRKKLLKFIACLLAIAPPVYFVSHFASSTIMVGVVSYVVARNLPFETSTEAIHVLTLFQLSLTSICVGIITLIVMVFAVLKIAGRLEKWIEGSKDE